LVKKDPSFSLELLLSEKVDIKNIPNVSVFKSVAHEDVAKFNAQCDILVIPRLENKVNTLSFPSKLMEYLAMGIPVVGSRTSDIHKIVTHKENGMLYKPGDKEEFINCLLELKNLLLRNKIGTKGFELVKENYSWEKQGKLFLDLLRSV
jgi:glycosyltransferase involved in cell wall biosynthesis